MFLLSREQPNEVVNAVVKIVKRLIEAYPLSEIQVLSPMKKGDTGTNNLNKVLQEVVNPAAPNKAEITFGKTIYRVGDKVMQIKNNYDKQVFNGDAGIIVALGPIYDKDDNLIDSEGLSVDFNGHKIDYTREEIAQLTLAYAVTVHKSQGSEYEAVISVLTTQHYIMLARNLVYTAVSRAKERLVMIGSKKALAMAIKNNKISCRNTGLQGRLAGCFSTEKPIAQSMPF